MICTDDDMFKGDLKIQTPKTESTDYSTSSSDESPVAKLVKSEPSNEKPCHEKTPKDEVIIKAEPGDVLPVGLMARDPDGPNMHEVVLDSDTDVEGMNMVQLPFNPMRESPWVGSTVKQCWTVLPI